MAKAIQEGRLLTVNTPLGKDYLVIENIEVHEKVSELFEIKVRLLFDEEEDDKFDITPIKINQILGQTVSVALTQPDGNKRVFSGMVRQLLQIGRNRRFTFYDATIVPHVWKLTQNSQSRIFQQKRIPDILQEVFDGFEIKMQVQAEYKPRNYCVQYQESDWNFASRLMEEEGIYYYFEHSEETLKLVLRDNFKNPENCPNKHEIPIYNEDLDSNQDRESAVKSIQMNYTLRTGKVTVWDYNFQLTKKTLDAEEKSQYSIGTNQELESYTFPAGYARKYDGIDKSGGEQPSNLNDVFPDIKRTAQNRLAALDSQHKVLKGISDCCSLTPGYRFQLKNHPNKEFNVQYIVLSVEHHANQIPSYTAADKDVPPYKNEFTCIPHGSGQPEFRPLLKTKKPVMHGSQTAIIVGPSGEEIFTDKYGRVKVQFHWDRSRKFDADSSCWVRVAREIAGNKWGSMHIPRIGQEVIVDFIEGDPDQPIITGSVYNPETMPHYELPKFKTLTYFKTRTTPDDGKGFNELRFEDKAGKEQVFMRSQLRMDVRVRGSYYKTVGGNRQEVIGVRADNKPGGNLAVTIGGNYDLHVKDSTYIGIDGKLNETVKGDVVEDYQSSLATIVKTKAELNAMEIIMEATSKISLKVGGSAIVLDPTGITIVGNMTKINSGGFGVETGDSNIKEPLDAETSDTGEPGYLDRPRSGGGTKRGRNSRQLKSQHYIAPPRQNEDARITAMRGTLADSAQGRRALEVYDRYGVTPSFRPGEGSTFSRSTNNMNINPAQSPEHQALGFVHEMNHAEAHHENRSADIDKQNRADYVNTELNEETEGVIRSIEARQELINNGNTGAEAASYPLQDQYYQAYNEAVLDAKVENPNITNEEAAEAGRNAGRQRVRDGFKNGEVVTSNTNTPYPDYYGNSWDEQHKTP